MTSPGARAESVFDLIERALAGRLWIPRAVLLAWALAFFFSVPGYERTGRDGVERLRRIYVTVVGLKIDEPLRDMRLSYADHTNPAKRNFRLTVPALAALTGIGVRGSFALGYVCGYASLHLATALAYSLLGRRAAAFLVTLLLAGGYFGTTAFKDVFGWFDSVSFTLLLAAATARGAAWRVAALVAAGFTDERAVLMAPATLVAVGPASGAPWEARRAVVATLVAALLYVGLRSGLAAAFGLGTATGGIGTELVAYHAPRLLACLWSPFEGGWLLLAWGWWTLVRSDARTRRLAVAGGLAFAAYLASCLLVADVTRSMSFAYLTLFPLLSGLDGRASPERLRRVLLASALLSLVMPNLFEWDYLDYEVSLPARLLG